MAKRVRIDKSRPETVMAVGHESNGEEQSH
jgi:hypothetical protein